MYEGGGNGGGVRAEVDAVGGGADEVPEGVDGCGIMSRGRALLIRGKEGDDGSYVRAGGHGEPVEGSHEGLEDGGTALLIRITLE